MVFNIVQKHFATTTITKGIIEEVSVHKIALSFHRFHGSVSSVNDPSIDELALSIKQYGLLNPITVRTVETGFEIVTGNRRYLACKKLGLRIILCQIVELEEKDAFVISLAENLHRKSLDPLEEAKAFKNYVYDFGWGGLSDLASKISKSVSYVSKRLSLLELPPEVIDEINKSNLTTSAAEELIFIKEKDKQLHIAQQIIDRKLPITKIRMLIKGEEIKRQSHINLDVYDNDEINQNNKDNLEDIDLKAQRAFDKTISSLKIALHKIGEIIEEVEDNWIVYEMLMQNKNMINNQIDILIKEKKKIC